MLKIGWATRDFTPERPALLQGQMHTRVAREALDPLTLTCLAIEGDGDCALLISCDLALADERLHAEVRRRLADRLPETPAEKVVLGATHTHTSLVTDDIFYPHPGGEVMTGEECLELIAATSVEAAEAAWTSRRPHAIARAFGHAVVGHNRRRAGRSRAAPVRAAVKRPATAPARHPPSKTPPPPPPCSGPTPSAGGDQSAGGKAWRALPCHPALCLSP